MLMRVLHSVNYATDAGVALDAKLAFDDPLVRCRHNRFEKELSRHVERSIRWQVE